MITCLIYFKGNTTNLAVLLTALQPQLSTDDDIYIIDASGKGIAPKIATMYGTTRNYIFVETTSHPNFLEYGIQSMVDNKQEALLYLDENCFISSTFIANMKKTIKSEYEIISPQVFENPYYKMDSNFTFYNPPNLVLKECSEFNHKCFLLTRDGTKDYATLENEKVVILKGYSSEKGH